MAVLAYDPAKLGSPLALAQLLWESAANSYLNGTAVLSWKTALGNIGQTTGKWYFESTNGGGQYLVGLGNASTDLTQYLGADANSVSFQDSGAVNGISGTTGWTGCAEGDRVGIAYNAGTGGIWVRKNGGAWLSGDPVAGTGGGVVTLTGAVFPGNSLNTSGGHVNPSADISGSSHSFSAAVPAGFTQWGDASTYATPTQTFDTVRIDASVTLSNADLTCTFGNSGDFNTEAGCLLIPSTGLDTYLELTNTVDDGPTGCAVGFVSPLAPLNGETGFVTNTAGAMWTNDGKLYAAGTELSGSEPTWDGGNGNVLCLAISPTAGKFWYRLNGGAWKGGFSPNPTTHAGGVDLTAVFAHQKAVLLACLGFHTPAYLLTAVAPFAFTNPFPPPGSGGGAMVTIIN
jgi:hypothetical protein